MYLNAPCVALKPWVTLELVVMSNGSPSPMTPRRYFDDRVLPNFEDYRKNRGDERLAANAAVTAFQLADHFHAYIKPRDPNWPHKNDGEYKRHLDGICPSFIKVQISATTHKHLFAANRVIARTSAGAFFTASPIVKANSKLRTFIEKVPILEKIPIFTTEPPNTVMFRETTGNDIEFFPEIENVIKMWRSELSNWGL